MSRTASVPLLAAVLVLGACRSRPPTAALEPPQERRALQAVVVRTVALTYAGERFEAALRTEDVLAALWSKTSWAVLSPGELAWRDVPERDLLVETNLEKRAARLRVDPRKVGGLQTRIALFEEGSTAPRKKRKRPRARLYQAEVEITLTLTDVRGAVLAEVDDGVPLDPYAHHPPNDPRPEIKAAVAGLVERLAAECQGCVESWPRPSFRVRQNPAAVLARVTRRAREARKPDDVERSQLLLSVVSYFVPETPLREAERLLEVGPAACLEQDESAGLRAGDCITSVGGEDIDSPHTLARALARGSPLQIKVIPAGARAARTVELVVR